MIGILGGSFDPVHIGHLRLAIETRRAAGLERVLLVPLNQPGHRDPPQLPAAERLKLVQLAANGVAGLEVSDLEIRRGDVSYTIDTVRDLQQQYPDETLCLIIGMDAFRRFDSWKDWQQITDYVHIVIADRTGEHPSLTPMLAALLDQRVVHDPDALRHEPTGRILRVDVPVLDISSTRIRESIANGDSVDFLLPVAVHDYIKTHHHYHGAS